nr:hypothetical protein [Tanacetum cinerariifolium]
MDYYGIDEVNLNPTQIFIVHNWTLKKNQAKGPLFTAHMLAICNAAEPVAFQAPNSSTYIKKRVPKGVTGEKGANTQLSSVKSASIHTEPVYSNSIIIHSEPASGHDASAAFTAKADLGKSSPNDLVSKQQNKTKSVSEELKTVYTKVGTGKGASYVEKEINFAEDEFNTSPDLSSSNDTKKEIKLEDLSTLILNVEVDFMDLNSPEDDEPIIFQEEDEEEVHDEEELPAEFLVVLGQVSSIQAKIKTLDALPSLLTKVTEALDRFAKAVKYAPHKADDQSLPSTGQARTHPTEEEKNIR